MGEVGDDLRRLHGIGDVLARRFREAGIDTFAKVVAAGSEGLQSFKGLNRNAIPAILKQAEEFAESGGNKRMDELKAVAGNVKEQLQQLARSTKERFRKELTGKAGKRMEKELLRILDALEKVEAKIETKAKRAGKGLVKAEKRLSSIAETGFSSFRKGLKKARKSLQKVYS
jgi:hypothetical protein